MSSRSSAGAGRRPPVEAQGAWLMDARATDENFSFGGNGGGGGLHFRLESRPDASGLISHHVGRLAARGTRRIVIIIAGARRQFNHQRHGGLVAEARRHLARGRRSHQHCAAADRVVIVRVATALSRGEISLSDAQVAVGIQPRQREPAHWRSGRLAQVCVRRRECERVRVALQVESAARFVSDRVAREHLVLRGARPPAESRPLCPIYCFIVARVFAAHGHVAALNAGGLHAAIAARVRHWANTPFCDPRIRDEFYFQSNCRLNS